MTKTFTCRRATFFEGYKFCEWTNKEVQGNSYYIGDAHVLVPLFSCKGIITFSALRYVVLTITLYITCLLVSHVHLNAH